MKIVFCARGEDFSEWLPVISEFLPSADCRLWSEAECSDWQADYALVWQPPEALFAHQTQLKGIINLGAGVDKLLAVAGLPEAVPILKLRDAGMAAWMTDYVRYGLLHFSRDFDRYQQQQSNNQWWSKNIDARAGWPVGILGMGAIGAQVAQQLAEDGYPVRGWSRTEKVVSGVDSFAGQDCLDEFLQGTRVLINLLPSSQHTQGLINSAVFEQLLPDAVIINAGRGEVVDSPSLIDALRKQRLRGAMLDVFEHEPLSQDSPLWSMENVLITPHIAAPTSIRDAIVQAKEYIHALGQGLPVKSVDRSLGY
ncbi:2-hydroxyacid dehydrogenase [Aliamphritea ceti]|uniref:2-hydroxyacid dehydrogenase n=1 Tax=Aliamphritea ceti TaxID=1524258 RepID=UPI0021C2938A|nr:glyoxylate/hydroxypyruvate reductase A [Aliamphritea ceti]